jgi:hypothetical protein
LPRLNQVFGENLEKGRLFPEDSLLPSWSGSNRSLSCSPGGTFPGPLMLTTGHTDQAGRSGFSTSSWNWKKSYILGRSLRMMYLCDYHDRATHCLCAAEKRLLPHGRSKKEPGRANKSSWAWLPEQERDKLPRRDKTGCPFFSAAQG